MTYLDDAQAARPRPLVTEPPAPRPGPIPVIEKELRRQLCEFVQRGYRQRLMISTQGAFSARLEGDSFLITPHRVDRSDLDLADIVLLHGGAPKPARRRAARVLNHQAIYRPHPEVRAIVTAYPVNATAFSVTAATLDARTIPESYLFLREVQRVPYGASSKRARPWPPGPRCATRS